jgi:glycosyltransferase involved in cell wall biosynthesis
MPKRLITKRVVLLSSHKGWILEGIARESARAIGIKVKIIFIPQRLKDYLNIMDSINYTFSRQMNKNYLFINQITYYQALKDKNIKFIPENSYVFYTHKSDVSVSDSVQTKKLSRVKKIFVLNSKIKAELISSGIPEYKLVTVYGAIDRKLYYPTKKFTKNKLSAEDSYVLIIGDCKPRKDPEKLIKVIRTMSDRKFVIHGRGWQEYCANQSIARLENLKILQFIIENNPKLVREASVYLSLSKLEGGPFPTLESLASGTPVVATDTGWNREIIKTGSGTVLSNKYTISEVTKAINQAIKLKSKVKNIDLLNGEFTWTTLGNKLYGIE